MVKLCLVSDNHGDRGSLSKILYDNPDCDYYLHCGDSEMLEDEVRPFISVKGNNDYFSSFPKFRLMEIEGHRILIIHGHRIISPANIEGLAAIAKEKGCDVVFFGHIHIFTDAVIDGIRLINPGSTFYNRDYSEPCYAILHINRQNIEVKRINLPKSID
ncbi:MAG: YfcE family phosphodiesterase [Erysipelotrichaceae bacterium]|nr:YfcE family phosphodiesterase [Erysipelotrichaceae bacterium]